MENTIFSATPFFRSRAGVQAVIIAVVGIVFMVIGHEISAFESFARFVTHYDGYKLDDIAFGMMVIGGMSLVYSVLRVRDLRHEILRGNTAEENAHWIAGHDATTSLQNRRSLEGRFKLSATSQDDDRLTVFSIDLDGFKDVNDLIGHHAGDEVLKIVALRLSSLFDAHDLYRVGGDEFVAILPRTGGADPMVHGRQLAELICEPMDIDGQKVEVGTSVGYALYPEDGTSLAVVLRCADVAMYSAKNDRQDRIRAFDGVMQARVRERADMEKSLREAIRNDAVTPYYQPIIDLRDGTVNGFEALARWERTPGHFVPPSVFIEVAEQSGLIVVLSESMLRMACRDALRWPEHIVLSFNVSPTQLQDPLLGIRILQIIGETGLPPWRLEIEITETALVRDFEVAERIISDLRDAKIRISLDDFGTGYSSLAQLSKFSFDKIKIDRSFVSDNGDPKKREKIVRSIVGLGKGLDIITTAEGIETKEQLEILTAMGCNLGQGYLFGKAMPAFGALAFLALEANHASEARA